MKIVKEPLSPPHACCVIPGRGASSEPEGFVDTGNDMPAIDPHIYVSFEGVRQMGKMIGLHPNDQFQNVVGDLDEALAEIVRLEGEIQDLEQMVAGLETAAKRRGRKKVAA